MSEEKKGGSKTVRLEDEVYIRLDKLRDWKMSYSQVVSRLLDIHDQAVKLQETLLSDPGYSSWRKQRELQKAQTEFQKAKEVKP